jgi:predicted alpha/beta-hydrolase family hydrolase
MPNVLTITTSTGPARVDLDLATGSGLLLVIGHGAGGSVDAADLLSIRRACLDGGISVARVTQPYRVAGRKAPPAAPALDQAWREVLASLGRRKALKELAFVYAGRSSGARVACRTAVQQESTPAARAVVAISFPEHPPGRPDKSRLAELTSVQLPVLVVQGVSDPFGMPPAGPARSVVALPGDHSLKASAAEVGPTVASWLAGLRLASV